MLEEHVYTVTELNRIARDTLETGFSDVWLRGEISELKRAASGHVYFTLKDESSELAAVRFRGRGSDLASAFAPAEVEQGMTVLAFGKLTIYEPRGRYQFVATLLQPIGAGALQAAIERRKQKLQAEGLFAAEHKVPLPRFPQRIGVVTSPSGAALRDIASVLSRRWPASRVYLFPASVQGADAPGELVAALDAAARFSASGQPLDALIIGRGGGSAEDLAAFSEETVVRAVFACPIPIVSAVGHEIDFALCDFAADLRAPTPASAAELLTPDVKEWIEAVSTSAARMSRAIAVRLSRHTERLRACLRRSIFLLPARKIETAQQQTDGLVDALGRHMSEVWVSTVRRYARARDVLRLSDPQLPLRRGYSMTFLRDSQALLRSAADACPGAEIETRLAEGRLRSRVEEVIDP
jgi:exodeoxyribonuclease VII large subunit